MPKPSDRILEQVLEIEAELVSRVGEEAGSLGFSRQWISPDVPRHGAIAEAFENLEVARDDLVSAEKMHREGWEAVMGEDDFGRPGYEQFADGGSAVARINELVSESGDDLMADRLGIVKVTSDTPGVPSSYLIVKKSLPVTDLTVPGAVHPASLEMNDFIIWFRNNYSEEFLEEWGFDAIPLQKPQDLTNITVHHRNTTSWHIENFKSPNEEAIFDILRTNRQRMLYNAVEQNMPVPKHIMKEFPELEHIRRGVIERGQENLPQVKLTRHGRDKKKMTWKGLRSWVEQMDWLWERRGGIGEKGNRKWYLEKQGAYHYDVFPEKGTIQHPPRMVELIRELHTDVIGFESNPQTLRDALTMVNKYRGQQINRFEDAINIAEQMATETAGNESAAWRAVAKDLAQADIEARDIQMAIQSQLSVLGEPYRDSIAVYEKVWEEFFEGDTAVGYVPGRVARAMRPKGPIKGRVEEQLPTYSQMDHILARLQKMAEPDVPEFEVLQAWAIAELASGSSFRGGYLRQAKWGWLDIEDPLNAKVNLKRGQQPQDQYGQDVDITIHKNAAKALQKLKQRITSQNYAPPGFEGARDTIADQPIFAYIKAGKISAMSPQKMASTVRNTAGDDFWGLTAEALEPRQQALIAENSYNNLLWPTDSDGKSVKVLKLHDFRRYAAAKLWNSMAVPDIDLVAEFLMHKNKQVTAKHYLEQMGVSSQSLYAAFGRSRNAINHLTQLGYGDDYRKVLESTRRNEINKRARALKVLEPLIEKDHKYFPDRLDEVTEQWQAFMGSEQGGNYSELMEVAFLIKTLDANPAMQKKLLEQAARRSLSQETDEAIIKRIHKAIVNRYNAERKEAARSKTMAHPEWEDVIKKVLGAFEERLSRPIPDVPPKYLFEESEPFKVYRLIDKNGEVWGDFASPIASDANKAAELVGRRGAEVKVKEFTDESLAQWERYFPDFARWRSFMWNNKREEILKHPDYREIIERIEVRNKWTPMAHQAGLKEFHPTQQGPLSWDSYSKDRYEKGLLLYDINTRMPTRVTPDEGMQDALALARKHVEDWLTQIQKNQPIKNTTSLVKYDGKVYVMTGPGSLYELVPKSEYIKAKSDVAYVRPHKWEPGHPAGYTGVTVKYKGAGDKKAVDYVMRENVHVYYPEETLKAQISIKTWMHEPVLGNTALIKDGAEVTEVQYAVIDVRDAVKAYNLTPERTGLVENELFPNFLRRQEAAPDAVERIKTMAQTIQPEHVINLRTFKGRGVPVLNHEKITIDGSGRLLALQWAGEVAETASDPRMTHAWEEYQRYLEENIASYGISVKELLKGDKKAVLVRFLKTDLNDYHTMRFVDRSNLPTGIDEASIKNFAQVVKNDRQMIREVVRDLGLSATYAGEVGRGSLMPYKQGRDFEDIVAELYREGRLQGTGVRSGVGAASSLEMDVPPWFRDRVARGILLNLFDDEKVAHQIAQAFADSPDIHVANSVSAILNNYSGFSDLSEQISSLTFSTTLSELPAGLVTRNSDKKQLLLAKEYYGILDDMAQAISFLSTIKPLFPHKTVSEIIDAMARGQGFPEFKFLFMEKPRLLEILDFIGRYGKEPEPLSDVLAVYTREFNEGVRTASFNTTAQEALRNAIKNNIPDNEFVKGQRSAGKNSLWRALQAKRDASNRKLRADIPEDAVADEELSYGKLATIGQEDESIPAEEFDEDVIRHLFGFLGVYRKFPRAGDLQWYDDLVKAIRKMATDPEAKTKYWRNFRQRDYAKIIGTASELLGENIQLLDDEILAIINQYPELRPLAEGVREMPVPAYQSLSELAGRDEGMEIVLEASARYIGERATQLVTAGLPYDMRVALGWLSKWMPESNGKFLSTAMEKGPEEVLPYSMISKYHELVDHALLNAGGMAYFPVGKYHVWDEGLKQFNWTDEGMMFRDDLKKLMLAGQEAHVWHDLGGVPEYLDADGVKAVASAINDFAYLVWGEADLRARGTAPGIVRSDITINGRRVTLDRVSGQMQKSHAISDILNQLVMSGEGTLGNPGLGIILDGSAQYQIVSETNNLRLWNAGRNVESPREGVENLNRYHYGALIQKYNQHNLIPVEELSEKQIMKYTGGLADNVDDMVKLINQNLRVFHREMMGSYKKLSAANRELMERVVPKDALSFTKKSHIAEPLITEMRDYVKAGRVRAEDLGIEAKYRLPCPPG